jgi:hypothetical protein
MSNIIWEHKERGGKHQGGIFKHGTITRDDDVMLVKWDFKRRECGRLAKN